MGNKVFKKVYAIFREGVLDEDTKPLKEFRDTLNDMGFSTTEIDVVLKDIEDTRKQELEPEPEETSPGDIGVETLDTVLKPGTPNKPLNKLSLHSLCAEDLIEDRVAYYMDRGVDPLIARCVAEKDILS